MVASRVRSRHVAVIGIFVLALAAFAAAAFAASTTNTKQAKKNIAPYLGHPSPFPVTTPLTKKLPAGKKFVYLQCAAPTCALAGNALKPAVAAIGGQLTVIPAGFTAQTAQSAAASALALKPDVVIVPAITGSFFSGGLKKLHAAGAKVVSVGMDNAKQYGVDFGIGDIHTTERGGRLLADWIVANKGPKANVVFYGAPELDFSKYMQQAFVNELRRTCPSCKVRTSSISVLTIGSTAPATVVNDLRAHPDTNTAVFATLDAAIGLPPALKTAGLSPTTFGFAPGPVTLTYIKQGLLTGALAADLPAAVWQAVGISARLMEGQKVPAAEAQGDYEFIGPKQVPADVSSGWTGYPNYPQRFKKLWHVG
jgi:ribose transport system substrate-binding protein